MKEILEHAEIVLEENYGPFPYPSILQFTSLLDSDKSLLIKITENNCGISIANCFKYSIANLLFSGKIRIFYSNERNSYFFNLFEWFTDEFKICTTDFTKDEEDPLSNTIIEFLNYGEQGKKYTLDSIIEAVFFQLINKYIYVSPKLEFCEKYLTSFAKNNPWINLQVKKRFWGLSKSLLLEIDSNRINDLIQNRKSMYSEVIYFQRYNSKFRKLLIYIEDQVYKAINRRTGD